MTSARRTVGVTPTSRNRLAMRSSDLRVVQGASTLIADLGVELDRRLQNEPRESERLRMLRETTNRITRVANDAVQAYTRASRAVRAELTRPDANVESARAMRARLDGARREVLRALEHAKQRYAAADEPPVPGVAIEAAATDAGAGADGG
jgi:hypothetical protein